MASDRRRFLLSGAVLLSVLAVAAAALESVKDECQPGVDFPHNPLATCHTYVIKRVCGRGPSRPMLVKERCCRELAAVPDHCRCEALRILMDGVRTPEGRVVEGRLGDRRDCPREEQRTFAATLVTAAEFNLSSVQEPGVRLVLLADG
uniref:Limit dextrinase inhibitor n=1 Tax=Hordeum vulgare TaxID=4513 RepID=G8FGC5_HORVU|nr:limit dextrinase inhibitor [Hordeum vulgare]